MRRLMVGVLAGRAVFAEHPTGLVLEFATGTMHTVLGFSDGPLRGSQMDLPSLAMLARPFSCIGLVLTGDAVETRRLFFCNLERAGRTEFAHRHRSLVRELAVWATVAMQLLNGNRTHHVWQTKLAYAAVVT